MADVTSAGTLVAAALQTAGLAQQESILELFAPFFTSAGALLYVFAGIGGVISVVLFNNFRMARYLLLGPALYWVLVANYVERGGVVWQLGGGTPRTVTGEATLADSVAQMGEVVEQAGADTESDGPRLYKVSYVFNWFTSLIDNFVQSTVDVILKYEDDENLLFIARTKALESLVNSKIDDSGVLELFQGNFTLKCNDMMGAAYALSSPHLDTSLIEAMRVQESLNTGSSISQQAGQVADAIEGERLRYQQLYDQAARKEVNPTGTMIDYMRRHQAQPGAVQRVMQARYSGQTAEAVGTSMVLTCQDMYDITTQAIMDNAEKIYNQIIDATAIQDRDDGARQLNEQLLCQALAEKTARDTSVAAGDGECNLVQVTAMFLIRNTLASSGSQAAYIQRHKNQMQFLNSVDPDDRIVPMAENRDDLELAYRDDGGYHIRANNEKNQVEFGFKNRETNEFEWHPVSRVTAANGQMGVAFDEHQSYQARDLRQQIFTWSMQLPYWQGTLLYLLSVAYPLIALVVILPGQARNFLHIPLAWLWVKSWDIGFALVMVFEKVLWNVLPQSDVDIQVLPNRTGAPPLPDLLTESFSIDPAYHVHAYYFMISMALLAIPQVTGYATLKAKKAILASFTEGPKRLAEGSGDRASAYYGITRMSAKQQAILATQGAALMSQSPMVAGVWKNGEFQLNKSEQSALNWAVGAAAIQTGGDAVGAALQGSPTDLAKKLFTSGQEGAAKSFSKLWSAELSHAGEVEAAWSSAGAYSTRNRMLRAGMAAMEGQTFGYDGSQTAADGDDATNAMIKVQTTRFEAVSDAIIGAAGSVGEGGRAAAAKGAGQIVGKVMGGKDAGRLSRAARETVDVAGRVVTNGYGAYRTFGDRDLLTSSTPEEITQNIDQIEKHFKQRFEDDPGSVYPSSEE